MPENAYW